MNDYQRQCELMSNETPPEAVFRKLLDDNGVEYIQNYPVKIHDKLTFFVDFYLLDYRCYVEIDGSYHNTPEQKKKDKWRKEQIYKKRKWKEVRIKNRRCYSITLKELLKKIHGTPRKQKKVKIKTGIDTWKDLMKKYGYRDPNIICKH